MGMSIVGGAEEEVLLWEPILGKLMRLFAGGAMEGGAPLGGAPGKGIPELVEGVGDRLIFRSLCWSCAWALARFCLSEFSCLLSGCDPNTVFSQPGHNPFVGFTSFTLTQSLILHLMVVAVELIRVEVGLTDVAV